MVKPPATMQPESVDLSKAGRAAAGRAFEENNFHHYMARKIDLQRKQFGLVLPPPPEFPKLRRIEKREAKVGVGSVKKSPSVRFTSLTFSPSNCVEGKTSPSLDRDREDLSLISPAKNRKELQQSNISVASEPTRKRINEKRSSPSTHNVKNVVKRLKFTVNHREASCNSASLHDYDKDTSNLTRQEKMGSLPSSELLLSGSNPAHADKPSASLVEHNALAIKTPPHCVLSRSHSRSSDSRLKHHRSDLFFLGVVVLINGYTDPDAETLQRLLHRHGGDVEKYETGRVGFVIATHLSCAKANVYRNMRKRPIPVVDPAWIVDSVQQERLLPYHSYIIDQLRKSGNSARDQLLHQYFKSNSSPPISSLQAQVDYSSTSDSSDKVVSNLNSVILVNKSPKSCTQNIVNINDPKQRVIDQLMEQTNDRKSSSTDNENESSCMPDKVDTCTSPPLELKESKSDKGRELTTSSDPATPQNFKLKGMIDSKIVPRASSSSGRTDDKYINGRIRTVGTDPNFLETFFSNSRLSFIGSFKQRSRVSPQNSARQHHSSKRNRWIFHVDIDSFFASVVLRKYPHYRGKPVVISHHGKQQNHFSNSTAALSGSTSECATCSYEARQFGITKGMFVGTAKQLCPDIIILPYDYDGYEEVKEQVADILFQYADANGGCVEQISCDEAYMEIFTPDDEESSTLSSFVQNLAAKIRSEIFDATECTASIGIAKNKLMAKLGTDSVKPNGCVVVEDHHALLAPLRLRQLHGIGYHLNKKLENKGLVTIQDVWDLGSKAQSVLESILGSGTGTKILSYCNGKDERRVSPVERKSIGAECSYGVRFDGPYGPDHMIKCLAKEVTKRMKSVGVTGGSKVTLKVKKRKPNAGPSHKFLGHGPCDNLSKSGDILISSSASDPRRLSSLCISMFQNLEIVPSDVRGIGLIVTKLSRKNNAESNHSLLSGRQENLYAWAGTSSVEPRRKSSRYIDLTVTNDESRPPKLSVTDVQSAFELPPLSQLRMSQLEFLPNSMKMYAMSKIDARDQNERVSNHAGSSCSSTFTHTTDDPLLELGRHSSTHSKCLRFEVPEDAFTAVKATICDPQISASSIASLPIEPADPVRLFREGVYPLSVYLDANDPTMSQASVDQVTSFFEICVSDGRLKDLVVLLRSVKKRRDNWSNPVVLFVLFERVNLAVAAKEDFLLDMDAI